MCEKTKRKRSQKKELIDTIFMYMTILGNPSEDRIVYMYSIIYLFNNSQPIDIPVKYSAFCPDRLRYFTMKKLPVEMNNM